MSTPATFQIDSYAWAADRWAPITNPYLTPELRSSYRASDPSDTRARDRWTKTSPVSPGRQLHVHPNGNAIRRYLYLNQAVRVCSAQI
ncbi:hypothetical protein J6590_101782 [Homalodisca vitripennis]|nr:hypothetical protein J6590_101782 [Homalodisca vitripennis]